MSRGYLISNEQRINLTQDDTIGRLSNNLITIPDPTISKSHASISFINSDKKFYIRDLSTVNGTYLNGNKLQPSKKYALKHKDCLQFGKHPQLYYFYQAQPEHEKKGKINLKDYCFELDSDEEQQEKPNIVANKLNSSKAPQSQRISKVPQSQRISKPTQSQLQQNVNKPPPNQGKKLKIPNLADYLQLEDSMQGSEVRQPVVQKKGESRFAREGKISLPKMENEFDEQDLSRVRKEQQYRRNLFLAKQAERIGRQDRARDIEEQKIKLQIQKYKQEQELLRKQVELERRVREQQSRIEQDKKRIEQQLVRNEQQRRQKQEQMQQQQRQKQKRFVEQLQQQKQAELEQIRNEELHMRTKTETAMREELERKKKDLELQAQALAQQYEQIYRDTIKKMKNDIEKEQADIEELDKNTAALKDQKNQLESKVEQVADGVGFAKQELTQVAGRNKAFILYASQLQNKLDKIKAERGENKEKKISLKLKEEILNSRKLLAMKKKESAALETEINNLKLSLNIDSRLRSDVLDTILTNHESIQKSKIIYFEYLRQEKSLKDMWTADLDENEQLEQQNLALEKDISNYKKQLVNNLRDNATRITEQRLHMLKCMHYLPEDKKKAAKFLIEEMVTMEEEIKTLVTDSEQTHSKIHSLIVDSERKKEQNQYLSQLLFGSDSTAHHFDNMKIEINHLMETIGMEKDEGRVGRRLKVADDIQNSEIKIHQKTLALQKLSNQWRDGLPSQKIVLADKNPITFFGDLLTKRELEMQTSDERIMKLEHQCTELLGEVNELERRKQQLSDSLQKFKRDELTKVRQSLL